MHFKNDAIKGKQVVPIANELVQPLVYATRAHKHAAGRCPSLFFSSMASSSPYGEAYFSKIVGDALTPEGDRSTAQDYRHHFATAWRDFTASPEFKLSDVTRELLDAACIDLMCTSTEMWDRNYDDSCRHRGHALALSRMAKFRDFVTKRHAIEKSRVDWDPLTEDA